MHAEWKARLGQLNKWLLRVWSYYLTRERISPRKLFFMVLTEPIQRASDLWVCVECLGDIQSVIWTKKWAKSEKKKTNSESFVSNNFSSFEWVIRVWFCAVSWNTSNTRASCVCVIHEEEENTPQQRVWVCVNVCKCMHTRDERVRGRKRNSFFSLTTTSYGADRK